jgi:hypothetical protein
VSFANGASYVSSFAFDASSVINIINEKFTFCITPSVHCFDENICENFLAFLSADYAGGRRFYVGCKVKA